MPVPYNRVRMTTATTGQGTITLGSAVAGHFTFGEAGVPDGATVAYVIEDGNNVEIGTGVYTSSGTTMTRGTVVASKISGTAGTTKLTLSGSAQVFLSPIASDFVVPQPTTIELGHASDTTLSRPSAGNLAVEGSMVKRVGRETIWIPADAWKPIGTPTRGTFTISATSVGYIAFDPSSIEDASFSIGMPKGWDEGNITFQVYWFHPATSTNFGVAWQMYGLSYGDDDAINGTGYATMGLATDTGGTTNDLYITGEPSAATPANAGEGEFVNFIIRRLVSDAADTMAVDAFLLGVKIYINSNAANDA